MKNKLQLILKYLRQGTLQKMWRQTLWIYQYGRRYWKSMILYTLLGITGIITILLFEFAPKIPIFDGFIESSRVFLLTLLLGL